MSRRAARGLVVAVLVCSCAAPPPWPDDLARVDHPDLARVDEVVRRQLASQRAALESLLGRGGGEPRELADAYGAMGRLYHAYDLLAPAVACYENARRLAPASFLWPYYLGLAEQTAGRFAAARARFEDALAIAPDNAPARLRLGAVLLALDQPQAAAAAFEPLAEDERYAAAAHAGLGRAAAAAGDAAGAVAHFERALELAPGAGAVNQALGLALRRLGRRDEARAHLEEKGAGEAGFPDPLAQRLEELAVSSGSYLRRANRALVNGRLEAAIDAYRHAVDADPRSVAARRNLALALVQKGDTGEALGQLEAAREMAPEDARVAFDLGNVHRARGDSAAAIDAYRRALELEDGFVDARFNLANALAGENRWQEAAEQLERVLESEPGHSRARYLAAMALHQQGRSAAAAERLSALVAEEPGNTAARRGLATVYAALGRPQRALEVYREAFGLDLDAADMAALLAEAAQLAWRHGRRDEAIGYFRRAVELEPRSSAALTRLANALQLAGRRQEAVELFARAAELDPDNATAWLSEASLRILAGDYARAIRRLEQALARHGDHPGLEHTLARLLATCPDPELRDGARALVLARQAYDKERSLEHAATVAMALAELGRFEEAVQWQRPLARQASAPPALRQRLLAHLKLYESRRPVRIAAARP